MVLQKILAMLNVQHRRGLFKLGNYVYNNNCVYNVHLPKQIPTLEELANLK